MQVLPFTSSARLQQPNEEQILRGAKRLSNKSKPTSKLARIYIYASLKPAGADAWKKIGLEPGDLPTGVLVGTSEARMCVYWE